MSLRSAERAAKSLRILAIDNYDSFIYTIVGYLQQLGAEVVVIRNDEIPAAMLNSTAVIGDEKGAFDGVLMSPGPGAPADAGDSNAMIATCARTNTPMLGICLGLQGMAEVFGGEVIHTPELRHGKTSPVVHNGSGLFAGVPSPFLAARYHSLAANPDALPSNLEVIATTTPDGSPPIIMALAHREAPLVGVQFHPESVLTEYGLTLLANWLNSCGANIDTSQLPASVSTAN